MLVIPALEDQDRSQRIVSYRPEVCRKTVSKQANNNNEKQRTILIPKSFSAFQMGDKKNASLSHPTKPTAAALKSQI